MSSLAHLKDLRPASAVQGAGSVIRKQGSQKLYVNFYYYGRRITKSTGMLDTPDNRRKAQQFLDTVILKRDQGTLRFSEAFPGASDGEKAWFAKREGWEYSVDPKNVLFGDYLEHWMERIWKKYRSDGKKRDYKSAIDVWIRPYFAAKTFHQINGVELQEFLGEFTNRKKGQEGKPLSGSRVRNVLIALKAIWTDACEENRWDLPDPFRYVGRYLPKKRRSHPEVFRFHDWQRLVEQMDPFYKPIAELMIMTGLIASELAGLRVEDIVGDKLLVRNSIVKGREKSELKTSYRVRALPINEAVRNVLEALKARSVNGYLVTMKSGIHFDADNFRNIPWMAAFDAAGLPYRVPYSARHSFAAWSLTIGDDPNRLVRLMGHGSKRMVFEVYGNYVEGLEADRTAISEYFGRDTVARK